MRAMGARVALVGAWFGGVVFLVLAVVAAGFAAWEPPADRLASPGNVTAFGTLALTDPDGGFHENDVAGGSGSCAGSGAFSDIRVGAELTIRAGGEVLGTGRLNGGVIYGPPDTCNFSWAIVNVPSGQRRYTLSMAGRGTVDVGAERLVAEIPLVISAPLGRLGVVEPSAAPPGFPELGGLSTGLAGTLAVADPSGGLTLGSFCQGSGRNADVTPSTRLTLAGTGPATETTSLSGGTAADADTCLFVWVFPNQIGGQTISIPGHGSVSIVDLTTPVALGLDPSGALTTCSTLRC
jgi:hypothetical protein